MQYINVIYTAVFLFPILAILIALPILMVSYHRYGAIPKWHIFLLYTFIFYMMCAYFLTILPLPSQSFVAHLTTPTHNFVPFMFVWEFFKYTPFPLFHPATWIAALKAPTVIQPVFNIFLTLPFGAYLHYYFRRTWKQTLLMTFLLSLFFELTQLSGLYGIYPRPYRLFDVDDLMLNTAGGMLGYALAGWLSRYLPAISNTREHLAGRSHNVSVLRRTTGFIIDAILMLLLDVIIGLIQPAESESLFPLLIAYLVLIIVPELFFRRTLGMQLVQTEISDKSGKHPTWYGVILRNVFSYGLISVILSIYFKLLNETGTAPSSQLGTLDAMILFVTIILMIFVIDLLIETFSKHHRLIFEKLSGTDTVSRL